LVVAHQHIYIVLKSTQSEAAIREATRLMGASYRPTVSLQICDNPAPVSTNCTKISTKESDKGSKIIGITLIEEGRPICTQGDSPSASLDSCRVESADGSAPITIYKFEKHHPADSAMITGN
jgi:hypothetical protein